MTAPLDTRTTAELLGAFRRELTEQGFFPEEAETLVRESYLTLVRDGHLGITIKASA